MKTTLIRTLMVTLLATSISAFAKTDDGKRDDAAATSNVTQQDDCNQKANDAGKQDEKQPKEEQKIEQQDREWLHNLMGNYGG